MLLQDNRGHNLNVIDIIRNVILFNPETAIFYVECLEIKSMFHLTSSTAEQHAECKVQGLSSYRTASKQINVLSCHDPSVPREN